MQSYSMPESAFDRFAEEDRRARLGKVHHQHLGNGQVRVREVFTGSSDRAVYEQMDARRAEVERAGGSDFHRTRIGRNTACPCGSGRKFKKCCIAKHTL